ncbi:MAG: alanyl-tRNA editing protein [Acidobacteriia bacterium]|nr:alanyl-tRNA editing protein [Terriglobia bacterium]
MTKHLYYDDSYMTEFAAVVLEQINVGQKPAVVLDRTAFYPASGGQPCDTGLLGGVRVEVVEEDASGRIVHVLASPLAPGEVSGTIDWGRRFDHMQQHTGQHILSQAFLRVAQASTLSFHLGQETSTIDIDLDQADPIVVGSAEELAARIIFEDRPVRILNVNRGELSALGVRKESHREGEIRVIDIEGFDRSPCGGTHVRRCGEIGMIFILGSERYKGGTRVEFVCGGRALTAFRKDHEVLKELGKLFSAHPHELARLTEKFLLERSALVREKKHLEDQILEMEAQDLLNRADKTGGIILIRRSYGDRKIESLKGLAQKATASPATVAILSATQETAQLVVARSADVPGDCGAAIKQVAGKLGGKGGGKPELAQAGGIAVSALEEWSQSLIDYFRTCRP